MQAIRTRYHGPTNSTGSCIRAKCEAGAIRMPYDYALNIDGNHKAACAELLKKLGWDTQHYQKMTGGVFAGDWYFVFNEKPVQ